MPPNPDLGLSCPTGGEFYVCNQSTTRFIGCCMHNPCHIDIIPSQLNNSNIGLESGQCAPGALKPASFAASAYDAIPEQDCAGPVNNLDTISAITVQELWYVCADTQPPFLGCCSENPCSEGGCPAGSLAPAVLSDNATSAAVFLEYDVDNNEGPDQSGGDNHDGSPAAGGGGGGGGQQEGKQSDNNNKYLPIQLGIGITALVIILITVGWVIWKHKRDKKRKQAREAEARGEWQYGIGLNNLARREPGSQVSTPTLASNRYSDLNVARDVGPFDRPRTPPKPPVRARPPQYSGPTSVRNLGMWSLRSDT
ncbi:hypothetical protein F5X99DRAFT_404114 [Biscogniauxia marginata]|nr:hypothetical protein F5X99DRAFT_404114 [Biscogniauxia marginata]